MIVWMMRSSTPLKKEISAPAVLMTQLGSEGNCDELIKEDLLEISLLQGLLLDYKIRIDY